MTRIPFFADIDWITDSPLSKPEALDDDDLLKALEALNGLQGTGEARRKREERDRLLPLMNGVALRGPETEHAVDELAGHLMQEMPWMRPAIAPVWRDLRRHIGDGGRGLRFRPLLLVGPPGIGKSHFARRLAGLSDTTTIFVDAGAASAAFGIAGVERGWGSAMPGRPLDAIISSGVGNPVVVVDEVCKAGMPRSESGLPTSLVSALLGLFEPVSARRWECPFFRIGFDMSHICWILTANDEAAIPEPLLSRCRVVRFGGMARSDLLAFAEREIRRRGLTEPDLDVVARVLTAYPEDHPRLNLRTVARHIDDLEAIARAPVRH